MKGDQKVIERLNEALFLELGAVNQYWLHYRLLNDWGYTKLAKKERAESIEEMQHADKLIDRIWQLPEVKALADKVAKESKGKRHLTGRISSMPSDDQEYYGVSISEDNGEAMATYFEFRIYPDNSIYYYDVVEDKELTLKEWRAQN